MNQDLLNQPDTDATPPAAPRDHRADDSLRAHRDPAHRDTRPSAAAPSSGPRASVDPMRATDRYRLARPLL